ncbi:uncharacterized protein LOC116015856 [Ipomoea triloba]|uniref:uncharacterized protein LOC116015856 n=1 Tax=Ipomoea triloba TaxID=35885 RepID=UPI00125DF3EA|nr:uncharacterized protein LOC116015856 [Ipomoea triloba]
MDKLGSPLELTGENYAYWKARTQMHLRAQGVWKTVLSGWDHPTKAGEKEGDPPVIKPEVEWTMAETTTASYNAKALDIFFSLIHESQFNLITGCATAKEAWEILETTYEGTTSVKQSKLQLVQSDFEDLRMNEDENIVSFNERVQEIASRAVTLGEPFSEQKLIKKVLRSLPPRFRMKVTAIQEHSGWEKQTLAELMGNIRTYEMEILTDHSRKQKNVAFTVDEQVPETDLDDIEDDDPVVLLTKHFNKILKQVKQKKSFRGNNSQNFEGSNTSKPNSTSNGSNYKPSATRTTQSREKNRWQGHSVLRV